MKMAGESLKINEIYLLTKYIKSVIWGVGDRVSSVVQVLCYKSEGRWFDPIFHLHKIVPIAPWSWGRLSH